MPSTAQTEPLGLPSMSRVGLPSRSTYWVAIWPFSASWARSSGGQRNRPSPWEMGTLTMSPTWTFASQGDRLEATRVRTIRDWWRPMTL